MPITSVAKDTAKLTLTVVGDFPVSQRRLWDAYADPRQLERFWGPPAWPARFTRHDFKVGGRAEYVMTGRFTSLEAIEQMAANMEEGLHAAMPQLDALLAERSESDARA
jgi:uncharacterized protein YndB with AHSA1/START domain